MHTYYTYSIYTWILDDLFFTIHAFPEVFSKIHRPRPNLTWSIIPKKAFRQIISGTCGIVTSWDRNRSNFFDLVFLYINIQNEKYVWLMWICICVYIHFFRKCMYVQYRRGTSVYMYALMYVLMNFFENVVLFVFLRVHVNIFTYCSMHTCITIRTIHMTRKASYWLCSTFPLWSWGRCGL